MIEVLRVLIIILTVVVTVVTLVYGMGSPWYRYSVGQRLFADRLVMAGLLWLQVLEMAGVHIPAVAWVLCILFFILIETWNFTLIIRAQAQARRTKDVDQQEQQRRDNLHR